MSEVNGVSEQIKILFNEKTQDIKELLDCVKKCIEIIKELKRENEYLKTMNDGLEQQKEELIEFIQHLYVNYHLPYGAMDIQTKKKFEEIKNKYK
jgi:cell division septum initiation protein DivIVA